MTANARCALEARLENRFNEQLAALGSDAKVDVVISCPNDVGACDVPGPEALKSMGGSQTPVIRVEIEGE